MKRVIVVILSLLFSENSIRASDCGAVAKQFAPISNEGIVLQGEFERDPESGRVFDPEMRRRVWDVYDGRKQLSPIQIGGQEYFCYGNANFNIITTHRCNARCGFCVDLMKFDKGGAFRTPDIDIDEIYYRRFRKTLSVIKALDMSISITGGEASADPRLPEILRILGSIDIRKKVLTTNGSHLLDIVPALDGKTKVIDLIGQFGLHNMNISRAHYEIAKNQEIMKFQDYSLSDEQLKEVVRIAKSYGIRIRLSVAMVKEGVSNLEEMKKYLDWAASIGVDNVYFRQLMDFDSAALTPNRVTRYYEEQKGTVKLVPIMDQVSLDSDFTFVRQVLGYYYYVEIFKYKGIDIGLEISDLTQSKRQKQKLPTHNGRPIIYELVFHPNGILSSSWNDWEEIINLE